MSVPDSGMPTTTPAYDPHRAMVASRDLSSGGAQCLQIPWQAGYVTPCGHTRSISVRVDGNTKRTKRVGFRVFPAGRAQNYSAPYATDGRDANPSASKPRVYVNGHMRGDGMLCGTYSIRSEGLGPARAYGSGGFARRRGSHLDQALAHPDDDDVKRFLDLRGRRHQQVEKRRHGDGDPEHPVGNSTPYSMTCVQCTAIPTHLLAGYMEARKPPGTWVIRYPQKNDISMATNDPSDQLICDDKRVRCVFVRCFNPTPSLASPRVSGKLCSRKFDEPDESDRVLRPTPNKLVCFFVLSQLLDARLNICIGRKTRTKSKTADCSSKNWVPRSLSVYRIYG